MGYTVLSSNVQTIGPKLAAELLSSAGYEKNRGISRKYVKHYAEEMRRGNWHLTGTVDLAHLNGRKLLVNGQHTLSAIVTAGMPIKQRVVHYQCDSANDVDALYAHFDKGRGRKYIDTLRAYDFPKQIDLPPSVTQKLTSAVMEIENGLPTARASKPLMSDLERMDSVLPWVEAYKRLDDAISGCSKDIRNKISARTCLPVALITTKFNSDAGDFWRGVAHLDGLQRNDPRGTLSRFLLTTVASNGRQPAGLEPWDAWRGVAHAWNKYYRGASLGRMSSIKQLRSMYPQIVIEGTPYTG